MALALIKERATHVERHCFVLPTAGESEPPSVVPIELGSLMLLPHVRQENAKSEGGGAGAKGDQSWD